MISILSMWSEKLQLDNGDLVGQVESSYLNSIISLRFIDTSILGKKQQKIVDEFISNENAILKTSINHLISDYRSKYPFYLEGWSTMGLNRDEIEASLPREMTEIKFLHLVSDVELFVNPESIAANGEIGLSFECQWDIENGLGVKFSNWQVQDVGTAQISFL